MRLLFADRLSDETVHDLEALGHTCVVEAGLSADDLPGRIPGFDGLVVRSTKVKAPVFEAADQLALVVRAGAGTNTIDTDAAATHGVLVCNVPGRNSAAVAELTLGLLLAVDRRIADNVADLRDGKWDKAAYSKADGLLGLHPRDHRSRLHRPRRGRPGRGVRDAGPGRREGRPARRRRAAGRGLRCALGRHARGAPRAVGRGEPARPRRRRDPPPGRRGVPRAPPSRRDPPQHLPRRRRRRAGPAGGAGRRPGPGRARRLRRRAGVREGRLGLAPGPAPRSGRDPPHRRLDRAGAAGDRHRRHRDHLGLRRGEARDCVNLDDRAASGRSPSRSAITTGWGCWPRCSTG